MARTFYKLSTLHLPWLFLGDFNAILARHKHKGGSFYYHIHKAQGILDFAERNNLLDLKNSGSIFTWCNNQAGTAYQWAILDRCLINLEWNAFFKFYNLKHLSPTFYDHSPLSLFFSIQPFQKHKFFHFENFWLDYVVVIL